MEVTFDSFAEADWPAVKRIYEQGLGTGQASFETDTPSWEGFDRDHLEVCRIAARVEDRLVGWAALSSFSTRHVYRGVAEVSVYVADTARGLGIGTALLDQAIGGSERSGIWTLQAKIFPENEGSIRMHKRAGFRIVGTRERIGQHHGSWRDVVLLERRSTATGT